MNEETHELLHQEYEFMKLNQRNCRKVQELLKTKEVKDFIKYASLDFNVLKSGYRVYTINELLEKLIYKYTQRIAYEDTNKIYVFMNSFKVIDGKQYFFEDDFNYYDYKTYHDIERYMDEQVPKVQFNKFKKKSIILKAPDNMDRELFYKKVQLEFFKEVLKTDQENAKKLILERYGR